MILVRLDGEGRRELALAPPPGREPRPFLRLTSLGAHMLALELSQPVSTAWVPIPADLVSQEEL